MITEKQRYRNWLECQIKDHGLVSMHACGSDGADISMDKLRYGDEIPEETYADLNKFNASIACGKIRPLTAGDLGEA